MHKVDVGIIIGGSLLTILTLVGVIGISSSKVKNMNQTYTTEIAKTLSTYTSKYNSSLSARYVDAKDALYAKNASGTGIYVDVDSDDKTNVTITHNGETVDSSDVYEDGSVNVNVSVNDNNDVDVEVESTDKTDDTSSDKKKKDEKPVIINGKEVYPSDLLIKQEDGTLAYLIQPGDTLCYISRLFGFSVPEIAEFNHVPNVNLIYANSIMRVPNWDHVKSDSKDKDKDTDNDKVEK